MPTAHDLRAWAKDSGQTVNERGSIPSWLADAWNDEHPEDPYGANGASAPDYPDGMTDADFETADAQMPPEDPPGTGETKPGRVRKPGGGGSARGRAGGGWRNRFKGGKPGGRKKAKRPRVPVDDLICGAWRIMARVARPVPPVQRVLRIQAPVAGVLLEDVVRDTVADRIMQPLARLQSGGKTAVALAGPPMIVLAITLHVAQRAQEGKPPHPLFMETATEMLREALLIWMDVAGPKFEAAMAREKDFEERYGQTVDECIAFLFSPPAADDEAEQAEEDAIRRAQSFVSG